MGAEVSHSGFCSPDDFGDRNVGFDPCGTDTQAEPELHSWPFKGGQEGFIPPLRRVPGVSSPVPGVPSLGEGTQHRSPRSPRRGLLAGASRHSLFGKDGRMLSYASCEKDCTLSELRATAFDTTPMTRATRLPESLCDHLAPGTSRTWHCSKLCKANHPEDATVKTANKTVQADQPPSYHSIDGLCTSHADEAVFCLARGGGGEGGGGGRAVRAHDKFADATEICHSRMKPLAAEHATHAARHESGRANTAGIGLRLQPKKMENTHTTHKQHSVAWSDWSPAASSAQMEVTGAEVCNKVAKQRKALDLEQTLLTSAANARAGAEVNQTLSTLGSIVKKNNAQIDFESCVKGERAVLDERATQCPNRPCSRALDGCMDGYMDKLPSGSALEM
jgi:hypothetical protein